MDEAELGSLGVIAKGSCGEHDRGTPLPELLEPMVWGGVRTMVLSLSDDPAALSTLFPLLFPLLDEVGGLPWIGIFIALDLLGLVSPSSLSSAVITSENLESLLALAACLPV